MRENQIKSNDCLSKTSEELEILLTNLKNTLVGKDEITIIGHDNIDVDSVISGVLLENLFKFLNINAHFEILEPIKKDDTYQIINDLTDIQMNDFANCTENANRIIFLIDHYESNHIGNVIGCIDHHKTIKKNNYSFSYVRNCTSASYMIYELMCTAQYPLSKYEAELILISMMVDTTAFRSSKALPFEVKVAKALSEKYNLDYDFLENYCLCLTPIDTMNIDEIVSNGQKKYNYNNHNVKSAYLQLNGLPNNSTLNSWITYLENNLFETEMYVFIIFDVKDNITYEYQITHNLVKKIIHTGILSRGKNIMPKIEESFSIPSTLKQNLEKIITTFSSKNYTLTTMESCTGGSLAGTITNVSGSSDILHESYVTYCNEAKIKFGVSKEVIDTYSVYSLQTAISMANAAKNFSGSTIGIGITGQLGRIDPQNIGVENNKAWYCIKTNDIERSAEIILYNADISRKNKKDLIIKEIINDLVVFCI